MDVMTWPPTSILACANKPSKRMEIICPRNLLRPLMDSSPMALGVLVFLTVAAERAALARGVDIDEDCRYAFETNNDAPFIRRDVTTLTAKEVNALFTPHKFRVLVGCAPCQPFSTYNQKNEDPKCAG